MVQDTIGLVIDDDDAAFSDDSDGTSLTSLHDSVMEGGEPMFQKKAFDFGLVTGRSAFHNLFLFEQITAKSETIKNSQMLEAPTTVSSPGTGVRQSLTWAKAKTHALRSRMTSSAPGTSLRTSRDLGSRPARVSASANGGSPPYMYARRGPTRL